MVNRYLKKSSPSLVIFSPVRMAIAKKTTKNSKICLKKDIIIINLNYSRTKLPKKSG